MFFLPKKVLITQLVRKPHDQSEIILSDPSKKYGQYGAHGSFTYNDKTLYQGNTSLK